MSMCVFFNKVEAEQELRTSMERKDEPQFFRMKQSVRNNCWPKERYTYLLVCSEGKSISNESMTVKLKR